jgi:hypothetical protein
MRSRIQPAAQRAQEQEQERALHHRKARDDAGEDAEQRTGLQREATAEAFGQHPDRERAGPHADHHDADRQCRQCLIGGENGPGDAAGRDDHAGVAAGERLRHGQHQRIALRQPVVDDFRSGLGQDRHAKTAIGEILKVATFLTITALRSQTLSLQTRELSKDPCKSWILRRGRIAASMVREVA